MDKELILKNKIKEVRLKLGLSQEELARTVGTTRQTIIAIETNAFNPSAKLALLLCIALNESFESLFYF